MTAEGHTISEDARAPLHAGPVIAAAAAIVAVEVALVLPGRLLAAQIADALLVLALVNAGPRRDAAAPSGGAGATIDALRALAIVPLIRVVALGLPAHDWSEPFALLALAVTFGAVALRLMPVVGLRPAALLAPRVAGADLAAIGAGAGLGLLAYFAGAPQLWHEEAAGGPITLAVTAAVTAACTEELVFRGLVQGTLRRAAGPVGTLAAAGLFAVGYLDAGSAALVLTVALMSVAFSAIVARTGALAGVLVGHVLFAVGAGAVWPALLGREPGVDLAQPWVAVLLALGLVAASARVCRPPADAVADVQPAEAG